MANLREMLYIVSSGLFIYGLYGLTGPATAVRGNQIAAVGMAVAILATLLRPHVANWELIVLGIAVGAAVGVPAARLVQMTEMPQMVAIFNGVGGGAVALLAWVEFRSSGGYAHEPTYVAIFTVFAAIVGSISFWGSAVAFAKLQELIGGKPITAGRLQTPLNVLFGLVAGGAGTAIVAGVHGEILFIGLLVSAAVLGFLLVLPIGGADMPVVISLLNAFTGLSAAATGVALDDSALIVAGMLVGASGTLLTQQMAAAMNRSVRAIVAGGFGGDDRASRERRGRERHGPLDHGGRRGDPARLRPAGRDRARLRPRRQPGAARAAQPDQAARLPRDHGEVRGPSRRRPHARPHERAPRRGRGALRPLVEMDEINAEFPPPWPGGQRRRQSRRAHEPTERAVRHADPRRRPGALDHRPQALDATGLRRHREPALLRPEDHNAVRRRQGVDRRRDGQLNALGVAQPSRPGAGLGSPRGGDGRATASGERGGGACRNR